MPNYQLADGRVYRRKLLSKSTGRLFRCGDAADFLPCLFDESIEPDTAPAEKLPQFVLMLTTVGTDKVDDTARFARPAIVEIPKDGRFVKSRLANPMHARNTASIETMKSEPGSWFRAVAAQIRHCALAVVVGVVLGFIIISLLPTRGEAQSFGEVYQTRGRPGQSASAGQIVVRLPSPRDTTGGDLIVQPNVEIDGRPSGVWGSAEATGGLTSSNPFARPSGQLASQPMLSPLGSFGTGPQAGNWHAPLPMLPPPVQVEEVEAMPIFEGLIEDMPEIYPPPFGPIPVFHQDPFEGPRVGHERLAYSLFEIDPAQPFSNFRIRTAVAGQHQFPDRAEYFWARTVDGRGPPLPERTVDYQELRFRMELGGGIFSTAIEVPFRITNPELNPNHAGLSDLQLATKLVMLNGEKWQITQYFGAYFPTGSPKSGLGTGHVSLEPGFLFRYKFSEDTWFHGETKFWFPLGAHPLQAGQVLEFAAGLSHVWWETDYMAMVPSLEFMTYSVLNGLKRDEFSTLLPVDGDLIFNVVPGVHWVLDNGGDLGLFEFGASAAVATTPQRFYDFKLNFDLRWSF